MIEVSVIDAQATLDLRSRVLRPGRPIETCLFPGDDDPATVHLGAHDAGRLLGIASLYRVGPPWEVQTPAWQLRGMAVDPDHQGRGLGGELLERGLALLEPALPVWCNARVRATSFYQRHGFEVRSEVFDIPGVGPHVRMWRASSRQGG